MSDGGEGDRRIEPSGPRRPGRRWNGSALEWTEPVEGCDEPDNAVSAAPESETSADFDVAWAETDIDEPVWSDPDEVSDTSELSEVDIDDQVDVDELPIEQTALDAHKPRDLDTIVKDARAELERLSKDHDEVRAKLVNTDIDPLGEHSIETYREKCWDGDYFRWPEADGGVRGESCSRTLTAGRCSIVSARRVVATVLNSAHRSKSDRCHPIGSPTQTMSMISITCTESAET